MDKDTCLEFAEGLESVKHHRLRGTGIPQAIADLMHRYQIFDLEMLNTLVERLLSSQAESKDSNGRQLLISLTPDVLLTSDFLAEKITSWVELVRTEIFGSQDAPFGSVESAEAWILQEEKKPPTPKALREERAFWQAQEQGIEQAFEMNMTISVSQHPDRHLEYLCADGKRRHAHFMGCAPPAWVALQLREDPQQYSPLNWLENETRLMTRATGFTQLSLVQFVLTGIKPILPRYRVEGSRLYQALPLLNARGEIPRMQSVSISIEITARDLTFEELRKIYHDYRGMLQLKRHKLKEGMELAKSHWEIYQLVRRSGGPPKGKGKVAFWESIRREWNELHPHHIYHTWKGIKLAYDRIMVRLEGRIAGMGVSP